MKLTRDLTKALLLVLAVLALGALEPLGAQGKKDPKSYVQVTPDAGTLQVGQQGQLRAAVLDPVGFDLAHRKVTWRSSDPSIATVNSTGLVTALAPGAVTIVAKSGAALGTAAITVQSIHSDEHGADPDDPGTGEQYATEPRRRQITSYCWQGVRRTAVSFLIGDAAFLVAITVLVVSAGGDVRLSELAAATGAIPEAGVILVAILLVVAALARSAQLPFHRWLPATLAAPTPVSALLHAGVVNAGAILVIRFSPLIAPAAVAMAIIFTAGAATVVYAAAVRLVKPDVKGRLVFSTAGQMGFMMMAVGLGAFAAAVFHLIAHALYKSALFLSAGTGVAAHADQRTWPTPEPAARARTVTAMALAVVVPVVVLVAAKAVVAPQVTAASVALLGFVFFTAAAAVGTGLARRLTLSTVIAAAAGITAIGFFYVAFLGLFEHLITPPEPAAAVTPWLLVVPAVLLLALQLTATRLGRTSPLHRVLIRTHPGRVIRTRTPQPAIRLDPTHSEGDCVMSLLVQAHVAQAAQEVVASWPIGSFIAVNPLAAHERTRFEHSHEPGITLTRPLRDYHADHASGRITGEDLSRSLQERIPELAGFGPLEVGAMSWSAAEILREEMLTAAPATPPTRAPFAPSDPLERYLTTWLGAFLDPDPQWPMPGRAHGFYTAWHTLAAHDPTLTRPQRRRLRALPDQALPSLAASLAHLGVEDADTVDTLRAELAALPGWTSYLKWRAEHTGDITLTDYLAVRLALRHTLNLPPLRVPARPPSPGAAASGPVQDVWERAEHLAAALSPLTPTRTEVASLVRVLTLHPPADHAFTWQAAYENHYRTACCDRSPHSPRPRTGPRCRW